MSKFSGNIENLQFPFDEKLFCNLLRVYCDYNKTYRPKGTLLYGGLCDYICVSLNDQRDMFNSNEIYERDKFYKKLALDQKNSKYPYYEKIIKGSWIYADGRNNNPYRKIMDSNKIEHRFYICPNREDLYKFSSKLYDKFKNDGVNFLFKTINVRHHRDAHHRRDAIVIYTDDNNVDSTLKSLIEFSYENKALIRRCHNTSIITMGLDNWIGYAMETDDHELSYTEKFSVCFATAIENFCKDYMTKKNLKVTFSPSCVDEYHISTNTFDVNSFFGIDEEGNIHRTNCYDPRLYFLSRSIIISDVKSRRVLYNYLTEELRKSGYNLNNFPVKNKNETKTNVKIKKPNE